MEGNNPKGFSAPAQPSTSRREKSCGLLRNSRDIETERLGGLLHQDFLERFRIALARRLAAGLSRKVLQHAIGASGRSLENWLAGVNAPSSEAVAACIDFFWKIGDRAFVAELYQLPVQHLLSDDELTQRNEAFARDAFKRAMPRRAAGGDRFKRIWPPVYRFVGAQAA